MDALTVGRPQRSPVKTFDELLETRAQNHEDLQGRKNATLCRSPRQFDSLLIKSELKKKRHLEFMRRRSASPELSSLRYVRHLSPRAQASFWTEQREAGVQTESGLVTIKESDVQRLADYLQEALWREEVLKDKLSTLRESASKLTDSSELMWTARCSEALLRNQIEALEAQLQVCLQSPKGGLKKMVLKMEKQKLLYEEKALVAVQKAIQEKTEALIRAEVIQDRLIAAKEEALRWQNLHEELKLSNGQLKENQLLSNEQLHSQVEQSRHREIKQRDEVLSLRQEKNKLHDDIYLLEEDNRMLREEIEHLRDDGNKSQAFMMQEAQVTVKRDAQVEQELRHTQEKLQLKEKECQELQTELDAMELEFQSSRSRLSQCRDELRQLCHSRKRIALCDSWWKMFPFFLLLLVMVEVAMLWLWYPPFREHVEDLYSEMKTCIEDYLMEMTDPQHSGCFRTI
ncbi:TRAF3-interacting JNK-activating modulator [Brachionichthys hirsutus]|uniref:TRAF3-interacting JNK-activating modulator n=1 Tax=Brachionichthys hirsutus TaxID=412623 RepID=UPI00360522E8